MTTFTSSQDRPGRFSPPAPVSPPLPTHPGAPAGPETPSVKALKPLRAYTVCEDAEGHSVVVFARGGAQARRAGAAELELSFEEVDSCRRSPEFDAYASAGKVPPLVKIQHGWWFECDHCGHKLDRDAEGPDGEELELVADGGRVYCSQAHMMAQWRLARDRQARQNAAIEACATHFHGWPISGLVGTRRYIVGGGETGETAASCDFDFPGRKGLLARWDLGSPTVYISECDHQAWQATAEAGRRGATHTKGVTP